LGLNGAVLFGWLVRHSLVIPGAKHTTLGVIALRIASYPSLTKEAISEAAFWLGARSVTDVTDEDELPPQLLPNEFPQIDGLKSNGVLQVGAIQDAGYLLVSIYDPVKGQSVVQLIQIRDEKVVKRWIPDIPSLSSVTDLSFNPARFRIMHPLLMSDGGLVFHGLEDGPLFKINSCSQLDWVLNKEFHHAIEEDADGNLWVSSRQKSNYYTNLLSQRNYDDQTITKISADGKLLFEKSVTKILEDNGYFSLIFGTGRYFPDKIHLNDIQPLVFSGKYWNKGDLLLSLKHISTILLYRPSTDKVIWLKTGPWLNQHDVDVVSSSSIAVFGNDIYFHKTGRVGSMIYGHNNIYLYNFEQDSTLTPFTGVMKSADIRTEHEGLQEFLPDGSVFVEETGRGRLLRLSRENLIWEYTPRVSDAAVSLLSWSRYLTEDDVNELLPILKSANCK